MCFSGEKLSFKQVLGSRVFSEYISFRIEGHWIVSELFKGFVAWNWKDASNVPNYSLIKRINLSISCGTWQRSGFNVA